MSFWRPTRKITAFGLWAFAGLIVGVITYGTIDRTRVVTEQMLVIPGQVASEVWSGVEQALVSDLSQDALYQDFTPGNAAFIDRESLESMRIDAILPAVDTDEMEDVYVGDEGGPLDVIATTTSEDVVVPNSTVDASSGTSTVPPLNDSFDTSTVTETRPEAVPVSESADGEGEVSAEVSDPVTTESVSTDETTESETVSDSSSSSEENEMPAAADDAAPADQVSWYALPLAGKFPLAQAVFTDYVTTTDAVIQDEVWSVNSNADQSVSDNETVGEVTTGEMNEEELVSDEAVVTEGGSGSVDEYEDSVVDTSTSSNEEELDTTSNDPGEEMATTTELVPTDMSEEEGEIEDEVIFSPLDVCVGYDDCTLYPVTFTGFAVPEFDSGTFLSNVELRLSLGAAARDDRGPQQFVVEYRYQTDASWRTATIIDIEDQAANSLNGGYYLVALDKPLSQAEISALEVRVSYLGDIAGLERAYIEAVWLEITSASFYEESDQYYGTDSLRIEGKLIDPRFHNLITEERDLTAEELPRFTMSYSPQQNVLRRLATAVFSENTYAVESVRVVDAQGALVDVPLKVSYIDETTWSIAFTKQPQKFLPGKYLIEVVVNENDYRYIDSFEFYWGVLAVNTTKGRYYSGEAATLHLAALTDKGDTICDAILNLRVVTPEYEFFDVPVQQSGACGKNNVTDIPDYLATFADTNQVGRYSIQLEHRTVEGEVVHRIENHFEVMEYIPYEIERTAPTRIYPPAPYDVILRIKANRTFSGDVIERVPRGFVITDMGDALIETNSDHTAIVWRDVAMNEGDEMELSYRFDAPDISPYLYLLGPLSLDGYEELRPWQIASDAVTAVASLSGTRTVAGTNLNQAASPLQWSTSSIDAFYYDHSTSSDSHEVIIRQAGDYFLSVNLPQQRTDANNSRTRVGLEVRVNGVALPEGLGRSGYIRNQNGHAESSSHINLLLSNIQVDDVITVYAEGLTTIDTGDIVNVSGQASMLLEYIGVSAGVFAATTTQTTNSTNLNQTTEYPFTWTETRQDTGFVHSDSVNPEQIIISDPGLYYVTVNIPITGTDVQQNILGRVLLDGLLVPGGEFKQGYVQSTGNEGDGDGSIHWTGIVETTSANQVLTVTAQREARQNTVTVTAGAVGSIFVRELPTSDVIALRGTNLVGGTNWNPAAAAAVQWVNQFAKDATIFTHSTSSNSHQITVLQDGDYFISFNDSLTGAVARANTRVQVLVNGTPYTGAETKSHYIRNQQGHTDSSGALSVLLEGLQNGDVITVTTLQEASAGTINDSTDALLLVWKKATLDVRPDAPTMYNTPFDNIRFASTTPYFDFSATDPDGTSAIEYEFSIATSSDFSASTTFNSSVDSEFINTASSTDTSPFVEGDKVRLQLTSGDVLTDLTTYYWRVRARDVSGSGEFGDWSTTQSLTVDLAQTAPSWYQSYSGQFDSNTLVGAVASGDDRIQVDATPSSEILLVYGEGTLTTPRYRFWDGVAWGTEGTAGSVGGAINWVQTAPGVNRDEYVLGTVDANSNAYAQIYSASTSAWGNVVLLASGLTGPAYRGVAVAYESMSGDAMAVSCSNGTNLVYRIWNGTGWSATSTIVTSSLNNCNFVELASDPASDEIMLVTRDTGTQYEAIVWNGSAWTESRVIGSSAKVAREGISLAYEASGDQAVIVVSNNTANNIIYTTWNGSEFSVNTTQAIGNDYEFGRLVADSDTDALALCYIDEDNDIGVLRWNGGIWSTFVELETSGNADTGRPVDCAFETVPGRSDGVIAMYSDTIAVRYSTATSSNIWSTEGSVDTTNMQDSFWVRTERAGDGVVVAVALDDAADNLNTSAWNGSAWSAVETLETSLSSTLATPYEIFDLSAKRFAFSEGVVTTPPIDFTAVPNQPTWGDVTFSTSEPFGTDVRVRVKYTNVTTCDSYITDGVLSGNGAGFDVGDSPIDLTGLSTSTYNQICLEATLTTLGSDSAALEEWTLSWVRQPKLTQSNYQWFVNGSFLTPTDAWPEGAVDLGENVSLDPSTAVNAGEVLRLRLAVEGGNVALPAFSEAFKIQYAEGFTCSAVSAWHDVGSVGSSSALWRGYENAIVGDDWYSENWSRRVKLTVQNTVVEDDVSDFPVYVDLATLPSSFFTNVQGDGDDIRITESDGVTELPYELVSINTSLETGELHFKADLASTTDTEFFLYYDNPSASGYSVSATYGARNVWTNNFSLRYALDDSPVAASPQFKDSTSNNNNAVAYAGMTAGDVVTGQLGQAIDLDGDDGGTLQSALAFTGTFTASMWWNSSGDGFAIAGPAGANEKLGPWNSPADRMFIRAVSSSDTNVPNPTDGTWAHIVLTRDSSNKVDIHINGSTTRLFGDVAQSGTSDWINFGGETTQGFRGLLDELRFASVRRSNGWIKTEFNNQSNPTGFYNVSPEELISDGRLLPSTVLLNSDYAETYEEENPTRENQNALPVGDESEWDFVLQNNGATADTYYCFRLVYEDGSQFNRYDEYPRLITNAPPLAPELEAPFDNERLASTSPWFEFAADDELGDDVAYQIQVSTDYAFGSTIIDNNSITNFALFTNLLQPSQKSTFTPGQTIQYVPTTSLTNGNTYWWRVRAQDPDGSGSYGAWSDPKSFTVNTATSITTWFQTTAEQFATNNLIDTVANTGANDIGLDSGFTAGTTTGTVIDYDDRDTGNAWGSLSFTQNVTSGSIRYYVEYRVGGDTFALIPDAALSGNSAGFTTSPVSLVNLDPSIYNELRIVAVLSGNSTLPRLQDWTVTWSETIEVPTHVQPFDNAKVATTTPSFTFFSTDPLNASIQYELQLSTSYYFTSSSTFTSGVSAGFANTEDGGDTSPFNSGDIVRYTAQSPLTNGNTYWWRVRASSSAWSRYSEPQSFTVDTSLTNSAWFQTTGEQFMTDTRVDIATTTGAAVISDVIRGAMVAYAEGTGQAPQYQLWNGESWSVPASAQSVGAQIRWLELKAAPTRPEYAVATLGTDLDVNVQIYNVDTDTWGDVNEIQTNSVANNKRTFNLAYESQSGDLLALACAGSNVWFSVWNGTSWNATSTLTLTNTNNCEYIAVAADPTSDEITAVIRHTNASTTDFTAAVWNGSSWGNQTVLGSTDNNTNEGMAVGYEESGNQAIVTVSNSPNANLLWNSWNGTSWAGATTTTLGDFIEWAVIRPDVGTDQMALCYQDNDIDVGVLFWDGSNWGTFSELDIDANADNGRAVDCTFETSGARDGNLMVVYSDTIGTRYQFGTSSFSGEATVSTITDTSEVQVIRTGDGLVMMSGLDDAVTPDRVDHSRWDGTLWTTRESFTLNSSLNGLGFYMGGSSLAAQVYPNVTSGSIRSTPVDFEDGDGPRWEAVSWNDTTPNASTILYRVYYESSPGVFSLIPDTDLPGNSTGFTTSPIDISGLNRVTYAVLQIDAQFSCESGFCPTLEDWTVEWSEGITVSGTAREFDGVATTTSGTVAVAVNGVLQTGKTTSILGDGTWSISNVTIFPNDTVVVYVDGGAEADEATAIATYSGVGNLSNLELRKRHVTIGGTNIATTTNFGLIGYDNSSDEDILFSVTGAGVLTVCAQVSCGDGALVVRSGTTYIPGANITTTGFINQGVFSPATSTIRVGGSWLDQGIFTAGTSHVIFTATSSSFSVSAATSTLRFNTLTFGETSGSAVWSISQSLQTDGVLAVTYGTLARSTSSITVLSNLTLGTQGNMTGIGTTTFAGTGSHTWGDAKPAASSTNVGRVVVDGTTKTVTLAGNVAAQSVVIGADDTLNSSGSGYTISVYGSWINNNSFVPQNGTVNFVGTTTTSIARGSSAFNNLTFSGVGGAWSFSSTTLAVNGNLTIATGTVTLPTGTTTIAGSFLNTGGTFLHNNGEVRMTSSAAGRTITQSGTAFLNAFYDLVFTGSGSWTFSEANATTSRDFRIQAGTVTFPSGQLTVGEDLLVSGSGVFNHNNGEVVLVVQGSDVLRTNGSALNNVRTIGGVSSSWYNDNWSYRLPITVQASAIDEDLTNFPVYVDLDDLPGGFWGSVQSDGDDLRITQSDGVTEVPIEVVTISTGATDGEIYFRANSLSSSTNSVFYLYYGNPSATGYVVTDTYGDRNVWSNGYVIVAHSGDLTTSSLLNSAGTLDGTKTSANNPLEVTTGQVYGAQDHSGDLTQFTGAVLENASQYNISLWFNPDSLTGGNADEQNFGRSLYGISPSAAPYQWLRVGGTANPDELTVCAYTNSTTCTVSSGADLVTGAWYYASVNAVDAGATTLRVNGVERLSFTNPGDGTVGQNFTIGDLRGTPQRNVNFDGRIDEVRVSNVIRTNAWRDAEYRNLSTSTSFYTMGGAELSRSRIFTDTNVTILGNLVTEVGGDTTFPTGVLSIGGSFDNNAEFYANDGTVRFNSTAGAETVAAGGSAFATLEFNSATGDFVVTEHATATTAINLTTVQQFTVNPGVSLTSAGSFTHSANGANTTWTGATLRLISGGTVTLNTKTHGGDVYGTLEAASSTLVRMWNSSATVYQTTGATGAIYSQDHAAVDGDLSIYGNYTRASGTEYWSYATDFDGAALSTSSARQVDVRIASSSVVTISSSTLSLVGVSAASTTVSAISGAYDLILTSATTSAEYFTFAGMSTSGVQLLASTTIAQFTNGVITIIPGRTGVSVDGATVNQNASGQFLGITFATTTPGTATNVTLTSASANFIWFRSGSGDLYGEDFDAGDTDPGAIRFDDSSYIITVSGVVYADDGVTPLGSPTCDGITPNVRIVVDGGTYTDAVACNGTTGVYTFSNVAYVGDPKVIVYLDTNGGAKGSVVTKTPTANITNFDVYANRVTVRHEDVAPLTIADMVIYDGNNDADVAFFAATGTPNTLLTAENTELYVFASSTFTPGGNITLAGNGNANGYEGTLAVGAGASFVANGTETHALAGRLVLNTGASLVPASSTFAFIATTTGKSITAATSSIALHNLVFSGVGGGWNIGTNLTLSGDMTVATGTVTGTSNLTLSRGSLTGNGVLSLGGGTTTIERSNSLGGATAWTFNNLVLGNGTVVGTTTPVGTATTTILGRLSIANAHFLDAGNSSWDLAGTGSVLIETGTYLEDTSTVRYSGAGANVLSTTYYNLLLEAGVGTPTYTAQGSGILVLNNLTIGGTAASIFDLNTNDVLAEVRGVLAIRSNGTLLGSNSVNLLLRGDWTNDGVYTANSGTVRFIGTGGTVIAAGTSAFATVEIDGPGTFTLAEHATATAAWRLINHSLFTVGSGQTLAVGGEFLNNLAGANTTFTGSTLYLYGVGTYDINDAATSEQYESFVVASGTQARIWNTSFSSLDVRTGGSLYSQDHSGVDGNLYIYGQLVRTVGDDYWSYDTDFDGSDLTGGDERQANVYFSSGASATWTGGSLVVIGTSTASTTLQNQGSGTYALVLGGTMTTEWDSVEIRDTNAAGVVFTGTPTVVSYNNTDHEVAINSGTALTVSGTVIDANPAKNFTGNRFAESGGVTSPKNVTASGSPLSSWRFTNHVGNIDGEAFDDDPAGDPGYVVWDDSAALITVAGNVYSDEGVTVSGICDGVTANVRLVVAGLTTYDTTCDASTGAYSISNVAFSPLDTLTLYVNGESVRAANVSVAPISSISNMHLYVNRVIVRHENTNPLTIADMAVWDSSDDGDIPFTATNGSPDTLTLPADYKLIVWASKTFAPGGNVTVSGGGAGAAYDGTLEVQNNATFRAAGTEAHAVGGSFIFGASAQFVAASSTLTLTTSGAARTVDTNANSFHNLTITGSGSWNVTDATLNVLGSYTQSAGTFTLPVATTTIGSAFAVNGGSISGGTTPFVFTTAGAGTTVRFNGATVGALTFNGVGSWDMTDVNATSSGSVTIVRGTVSLPSGSLSMMGSFRNVGGVVTHNTSDIIMRATTTASVLASTSDLFAVRLVGGGAYTFEDSSLTLLDSLEISSGNLTIGTGTLAIGGSFTATGGTFSHASGTVLLNAAAGGRVIDPGMSSFYNLQIGAPAGGYTLYSATTTNNLTIANVNNLTVNPGSVVTVGGVFLNSVGGVATTWTSTTLRLLAPLSYSINTRTNNGDVYGSLEVGSGAAIRSWYSAAATTTVAANSSLYSQDHNNSNGRLEIYGNLVIATSTEYWSYATDFDGTSLSGSERATVVAFAPYATATVTTGVLNIIGASGNESLISNNGTGTYSLAVTGGTLNANYYEFNNLGNDGLQLSGLSTITNLANGYFDLAVNTGSLITLSSTTLNANPSKIFDNVGFNATGSLSGFNVELVGETSNAWRFTNSYGSIGGEGFDIDGLDACGSIRFDDSSCLLTEQTHYRWRNDDGGGGVPNSEWYDTSWQYRQRVRILNNDNQAYASTTVKVSVSYDSNMQSDFADLRFTADDGVTPVSFWLERYTASTDATVWVRVPTLPASDHATVYMYYGSSTATSLSNGADTFVAFDDYEDNSLSEYSGDTSLFTTVSSPVFGGSYALRSNPVSGKTTNGIFRFDDIVSQGEIIRYMQYVDAGSGGNNDEPCTLFGVQSPGTTNQNYAVCLERFGVDRVSLARNVQNNDLSGTVLATTTVTYSTGWYEVEVDWRTSNVIFVSLYNSAGSLVATTSATDSNYTSGGYGYAYWYQNGAWDSFTSRPRVTSRPTVYFGAEQTYGGASWLAAQDVAGSALPNVPLRLRFAIENSGLDITGQQFRLEYAAKGAAPTCESVGGSNYAAVPNQASCGTSPVCMATSSNVTNGAVTTDLLFGTNGTFSAGEVVTSPGTQTSALDVDQDFYTEIEYALVSTVYASDAYCFRTTNAGTELDFYGTVAELALRFDPQLSSVALNEGLGISLTPGTTTMVIASTTVTDFNGYTDIEYATATVYRSGAGAACTPDDNNCYVLSTENGGCSFQNCNGNTCALQCAADISFFAEPTDVGSVFEGQEWLAYVEVEDVSGGYDFESAPGVELFALRAIQVDSLINYGALEANSDTGANNASTTVTNLGNVAINIDVEASDLTDGNTSVIPAEQQKMATSTFTYSACVSCYQLSSSSPVALGVNLSKPTTVTPPIETDVYWGIAVPLNTNSAPHTGINIFTPISAD